MGTELAPGRYLEGGAAGLPAAEMPDAGGWQGVGIELGRCRVGATKTRFLPKCAGTEHTLNTGTSRKRMRPFFSLEASTMVPASSKLQVAAARLP